MARRDGIRDRAGGRLISGQPVPAGPRKRLAGGWRYGAIGLFALLLAMNWPGLFPGAFGAGMFGFRATHDGVVSSVTPGSPAAEAGLRAGDRLDPSQPADELRLLSGAAHPFAGHEVNARFVRDGRIVTVTMRARPVSWEPSDLWDYAAMAAYTITGILATLLFLRRPSPMTGGFYLFCVGSLLEFYGAPLLLLYFGDYGRIAVHFMTSLWIAGCGGLALFALRLPDGRPAAETRTAEFLAIGATVAWIAGDWIAFALDPRRNLFASPFHVQLMLVSALAISGILVWHYRRATPQNRQRLKWVVAGVCVGIFAQVLGAVQMLTDWDAGGSAGWVYWLQLTAPLSVGYAVLRHRVVDIGLVINRVLTFAALAAILGVGVGLTVWGFERVLVNSQLALVVEIVLTVAAVFGVIRLHGVLESWLRAILFADYERGLQEVGQLSEALPFVDTGRALERMLLEDTVRALRLTGAALYRSGQRGEFARRDAVPRESPYPERLTRELPVVLEACATGRVIRSERGLRRIAGVPASLAPVAAAGEVFALVLYGGHVDGTALDARELAALQRLAQAAATAYRALVMRESHARELAKLIAPLPVESVRIAKERALVRIIETLGEVQREVLAACAVLPESPFADVAAATQAEDPGAIVRFLADDYGIVAFDGSTVRMQPELAAIVRAQEPGLCRSIAARLGENARTSGRVAAAHAALLATEQREAALEFLLQTSAASPNPWPPEEFAGAVAGYRASELVEKPALWLEGAQRRLARDDIREICREGKDALVHAGGTPSERSLRAWLAYWLCEAGERELARETLPAAPSSAAADESTRAIERVVRARLGEDDAFDGFDTGSGWTPLARAVVAVEAGRRHRARGEAADEARAFERAEAALSRTTLAYRAEVIAEGFVGAWLAGDGERADAALARLQSIAGTGEAPALEFFTARAARLGGAGPLGCESPHRLATAWLLAASEVSEPERAVALLQSARASAEQCDDAFLSALASVGLALVHSAQRDDSLREALASASRVRSEALDESLGRIAAGIDVDGTLLGVFVRAMQKHPGLDERVYIDVAHGTVRGPAVGWLSERELELVFYLARSAVLVSREELADALWPDLDGDAALGALKTLVYRVRQKFGASPAIASDAGGYRLGECVLVDLWAARADIAAARRRLGALERLRLRAWLRHLSVDAPAALHSREWFAPLWSQIVELRRTLLSLLSDDPLERGAGDGNGAPDADRAHGDGPPFAGGAVPGEGLASLAATAAGGAPSPSESQRPGPRRRSGD